jgi:predicted PurR-regulated permease PerM
MDRTSPMRWPLPGVRLAAGIGLAVLFLWLTVQVDIVIFAGVLLAIFLHGLATTAMRHVRLAYRWALVLVIAALVAVVVGLVYLFAYVAADQFDQLSTQLSHSVAHLEQQVKGTSWGPSLLASAKPQKIISGNTFGQIFGVASNAVTVIGGLVVVAFFGIYISAESQVYERGLVLLIPPSSRGRVREILSCTGDVLWHWMLGRLFSMSVVGACTSAGLWAIGMPVPLALGCLAGVLTFIPYIGAIISAVPSLIIALSIDPQHALWIVVLYLGVHVLEGYILVPLVQRQTAKLPPAVTLAAQLVLGALVGILGVTFATPLVAALITIVQMAYVEDVLGDRGHSSA